MKKKIVTFVLALLLIAPVFAFAALPAFAQPSGNPVDVFGGFQTQTQDATGLGNRDPREMAGSIINVVMGFLGIIAVIIILIGGFKWMTAGGDEGKVEEAKKMMTAGVIGLAIVLAAWGITVFVLNALLSATNAGTSV